MFKTHVGVSVPNGVWDIPIIMGMKPKHIWRYIGKMQWLMPFIGFDWRYRKNGNGRNRRESFGQSSTKDKRAVLVPV
jgi:hypothetical protein